MPNKTRKPRIVALLAIATLTLGVMAPAMASEPDETPPAQAGNVDGEAIGAEKAAFGAEQAAAGEKIAAEHQVFANETVQKAIADFLVEVERFTACMSETASANEEGAAEGDATLAYETCGPLDATQSPGHFVSTEYASALEIE